MASNCPICDHKKFRGTLEALVESGADLNAAMALCSNEWDNPSGKDHTLSTYRVKRHILDHTRIDPSKIHETFTAKPKPRLPPEERARQKVEMEARAEVVTAYLDEVASIDIDGIMRNLGLKARADSMSDVLTLAQSLAFELHLKAGAIALDRLSRFARDPEGRRYPSIELKGAAQTADMLSAAFGYQQVVSIQSATDAVERAGFEVIERGSDRPSQLGSG